MTYSFRPYHGPGVDSAPSENEYQEHLLEVKAAGAWGWQPHHLHVRMSWKSGSLNLLEPSGPHRTRYGNPLPLPLGYLQERHSPTGVNNGSAMSYYLCTHIKYIHFVGQRVKTQCSTNAPNGVALKKVCVMSRQCVCVFRMIITINRNYFPTER
jgi:hypothetical protein